jgi:zinc transporter 1
MALGVSIILQTIERFLEPNEVLDPILIMAIGAAGVGSNVLMIMIMGGRSPPFRPTMGPHCC